jgi:hypothetical protein
LIPQANSHTLASRVPNARLIEFDLAGHFILLFVSLISTHQYRSRPGVVGVFNVWSGNRIVTGPGLRRATLSQGDIHQNLSAV